MYCNYLVLQNDKYRASKNYSTLDSSGTTKEGTEQENLDVEDELQLPKVLADEIQNSKDFQPIVDVCCHCTVIMPCIVVLFMSLIIVLFIDQVL